MIPKTIHYCWFGGNPLPKSAIKCIDSWKKFFPDYEIKEWNESNFDVNMIPYTKEAYAAKKYAFVSDFARFWILHEYGGIYFDTDVEIIRAMNDIISAGPYLGMESKSIVNPGLGMAYNSNNKQLKFFIDTYKQLSFYLSDGSINKTTICTIITDTLRKKGLPDVVEKILSIDGTYIYPYKYFNPKPGKYLKTTIYEETRTIHHYDGSWHPKWKLFLIRIYRQFLPTLVANKIKKLRHG